MNTNVRVGSKIQLFGYYTLNYANSDTAGVSSFPSNSYNISEDYGRASFDTRHRLFFGGTIALPYAFRLSPFLIASSGPPFNITSPDDVNGDSIFNDRPGLISSATCPNPGHSNRNHLLHAAGHLQDALPAASQKVIPINYGTGPAHFVLNLRLTKTFGFGPKPKRAAGPGAGAGGPGGGGTAEARRRSTGVRSSERTSNGRRRLRSPLQPDFRRLRPQRLNNVNLAKPSGILGSRFFDTPNAFKAVRFPVVRRFAASTYSLRLTFSPSVRLFWRYACAMPSMPAE